MTRSGGNNTLALSILAAGLLIALAILYSGGAFGRLSKAQDGGAAGGAGAAVGAVGRGEELVGGGEVTMVGEPSLGNPQAPVKLVEFVDFQCPFCKKFADETFPEIKKQYVDTGKVQVVFKDLPLEFHPQAFPASEAANCANDQGKYLEMHDKIFAGQREWSGQSGARGIFTGYAQALALDMKAFSKCLDDGKHKDGIAKDLQEAAKVGARGTPSFLINKELFVGAQPFANFQQKIDSFLR